MKTDIYKHSNFTWYSKKYTNTANVLHIYIYIECNASIQLSGIDVQTNYTRSWWTKVSLYIYTIQKTSHTINVNKYNIWNTIRVMCLFIACPTKDLYIFLLQQISHILFVWRFSINVSMLVSNKIIIWIRIHYIVPNRISKCWPFGIIVFSLYIVKKNMFNINYKYIKTDSERIYVSNHVTNI